jgi:DNA-binding response OmpR family regulator
MNENPSILIIEDDADLSAAIKKILESKGYDAVVAYDPEEGNEKIKLAIPDLIILDVMFGSKGESKGFDFAINLRQNRNLASIPILMLTAINTERPDFKFSTETDGEFLPVDSFLDKPVRSEDLLEQVRDLLTQKTSKWQHWPESGK